MTLTDLSGSLKVKSDGVIELAIYGFLLMVNSNIGPNLTPLWPRPGSVVVEHSPGMQEVGGLIPGRVKQKTLKFEVLLLCLALSTKELATVWPARSQNNGLGWNITAYPWGGVSVG